MRLGVQLYTLRSLDEPVTDTIERFADTAYEGVQFSRLPDADTAAVTAALDRAGLAVAGAHVDTDDLLADPAGTAAAYGAFRCDRLVVPSYERAAFETATGAREAGKRLSAVADEAGANLHYHNHTFEFDRVDGERAYDTFVAAAAGVGLEVDTGLASHAGVDPVALIEAYADRVSLVHLTDTRAGNEETLHVDVGDGEVDIEGCVDAARAAGVDWLVFEHGLTDDPLASTKRAADVLGPLCDGGGERAEEL
jgi:sugar phosphate isomerase/epimerase